MKYILKANREILEPLVEDFDEWFKQFDRNQKLDWLPQRVQIDKDNNAYLEISVSEELDRRYSFLGNDYRVPYEVIRNEESRRTWVPLTGEQMVVLVNVFRRANPDWKGKRYELRMFVPVLGRQVSYTKRVFVGAEGLYVEVDNPLESSYWRQTSYWLYSANQVRPLRSRVDGYDYELVLNPPTELVVGISYLLNFPSHRQPFEFGGIEFENRDGMLFANGVLAEVEHVQEAIRKVLR